MKQQINEAKERKEMAAAPKHPAKEPTLSGMVKAAKSLNLDTGFPVWIHVYDLGHVSKWVLNSWTSLGAYHCGVELLGIEVSFQGISGEDVRNEISGITWHPPKL